MKFDVTIKDNGNDSWKRYEVVVTCEEKDLYAYGYGLTEKDVRTKCLEDINKYIKSMIEFGDKFFYYRR